MAQGPICIITSSGMICASSKPMTRHRPGPCKPEQPQQGLDTVVDAVKAVLKSASVPGQDTIGTVVQLMIQMNVDDTTSFTINAQ